jgi:exodeoxyribonuclease V alpha subunit
MRISAWVQAERAARGDIGPDAWRHATQVFYTGDRLVYGGENLSELGLTNSMLGTVMRATGGGIMVRWDGGKAMGITASSRIVKDVRLAYCLTVHKAQGSEYEQVAVPCFETEKMLRCMDRRWLYTAVSRGRKRVVIMCTEGLQAFVEQPVPTLPVCALHS